MIVDDKPSRAQQLADELRNFQEIARYLNPSPGGLPRVPGIEICGFTMPLHEGIGGDHIIYLDFNARYDLDGRIATAKKAGHHEVAKTLEKVKKRAGILLVDVSGHRMTDAMISAMLHQAFLIGVRYELDLYGEVTTHLFENINTRFYRSTAIHKYFTMIYGEISAEGTFRFLSAGHQPPSVFSRKFCQILSIRPDRLVTFPPVGMLPTGGDREERLGVKFDRYKKRYEVNEISLLAPGDILMLFTDGLSEHDEGGYYPGQVERLLAAHRDEELGQICEYLRQDLIARANPEDDVSLVLIRKTLPGARAPECRDDKPDDKPAD